MPSAPAPRPLEGPFYDALRDDAASLAEAAGDATVSTAPGCWFAGRPVASPCANLGLLRLAETASPGAAVEFAATQCGDRPALVLLVLDGLPAPAAASGAFETAGWRVGASAFAMELAAADVPRWDDALASRRLTTLRDVRRAHTIVAAACGSPGLTAQGLDLAWRAVHGHAAHTVYGAMPGGKIVATVRAVRRGHHCGLYLFATEPSQQRKGYGGALLDQVAYLEREQGAMTFRILATPRSRSLLEHAGFRVVGSVACAMRTDRG